MKKEKDVFDMFNPNHATISFKVKYKTNMGEEVRVAGSIEELGSWDLNKSILMTTSKETYPYWTSTQDITGPIGMEIYYKYAVYDKNTKKFKWENDANNNRLYVISLPGNFEINDEQGNLKSEVKKIQCENIDETIPYCNDSENDEQLSNCDFSKFSLLKNEIFELLSYDSLKLDANSINKTPIVDLTLKITSDDRLIIVTPFLPFQIIKKDGQYQIQRNEDEFIYSLMYDIKQKNIIDVCWIGIMKNYNAYSEDEINDIYTFLTDNNIYMVIVDEQVYEKYNIFVGEILLKVFTTNSIDMTSDYFLNYETYFDAFSRVNHEFSTTITNVMTNCDLIMINDVNLMLIPNYLLQKNVNAKVGIYFHSPFPSSDVFKTFPCNKQILKSVLLCDVIGFHVFQNARNFLTCVQRIMGLFYEIRLHGFITISYLGRSIVVRVAHCGNDILHVRGVLNSQKYKLTRNELLTKFKKFYNFVSVDEISGQDEYTLPQLMMKFEGFSRFVTKNKLENVVRLVQIIKVKQDKGKGEYLDNCKERVQKYVDEINNKFSDKIISLEIHDSSSFTLAKVYALFSIGDCLFYLPTPEACCMYSLDYISIHEEISDEKYGMIFSESVGLSSAIKGANFVNVYDLFSIVKGLELAYYTPIEAKKENFKKDSNYVMKNNIFVWLKNFFIDLKRISESDPCTKIGISMGLNFQLMKLSAQFSHLKKQNLIDAYRNSNKKLIFLDYEGTLQLNENETEIEDPSKLMPNASLLSLLSSLTEDPKSKVFVVSGRQKKFLTEWFGSIQNLGVAAEYGFFYKNPGWNTKEEEYSQSIRITDWSWKESVLKILQGFTDKTEGSYIIEKETMLSWVFSDGDEYFGHLQANEITTHLENILQGTSLSVTHGKSYLDIRPKNINKGYFLSHIIKEEFLSEEEPDLIIAIGDEKSDEEMFRYLNYIQNKLGFFKNDINIISCTIGRKPSEAKYFLNEPNEVLDYLESINQIIHSSSLNSSSLKRINSIVGSATYYPAESGDFYSRKGEKSDTYSGVQSLGFNI